MAKQPNLEEVKNTLPATFSEIYKNFPSVSSRGLRDNLNNWVKKGVIFRFTFNENNKKQGKPAYIYSNEKPKKEKGEISPLTTILNKIQKDLIDARVTKSRLKMFLIYKQLIDMLFYWEGNEDNINDLPSQIASIQKDLIDASSDEDRSKIISACKQLAEIIAEIIFDEG